MTSEISTTAPIPLWTSPPAEGAVALGEWLECGQWHRSTEESANIFYRLLGDALVTQGRRGGFTEEDINPFVLGNGECVDNSPATPSVNNQWDG